MDDSKSDRVMLKTEMWFQFVVPCMENPDLIWFIYIYDIKVMRLLYWQRHNGALELLMIHSVIYLYSSQITFTMQSILIVD